jgi:uncharacterized protein with HEPN domain
LQGSVRPLRSHRHGVLREDDIFEISCSQDEFLADAKTQDAILYNLIIIGEAANQISDEFQERHDTIPWSSMIGTRNIIVHGYDQVRLQIVWKILQGDLETLKSEITKALA